jgi:propionyl-CoA carboxylase alpha chain
MIRSVLVANRGEIARRVFRTCHDRGILTVAVFSDADEHAAHVADADQSVRLPGVASADTYLRGDLVIAAALRTGAEAVHPGYGFLSENAAFAQMVIDAGLVWIGPPPSAIAAMGSKIEAKALMRAAGVPVAPDSTVDPIEEIGVPALVKASAGGGGRGMRIVRDPSELESAVAAARREAEAAFGDDAVFVERYIDHARHVEVQIFADTHGNTVSLFERDCTLQRRHQKVIEESPSPAVNAALRAEMGRAAVAAATAVGYVGAGTVEFLLDRDGRFCFLEMNTRLQVEHPVTEMVTGLDLVSLQLDVASGLPLPAAALTAGQSGHAIEARLCAEDPYHGYAPSSGRFHRVEWATGPGVRVDSAIESGADVPPFYDSMVAKVIAHGATRAEAAGRLQRCLAQSTLVGPATNRSLLSWLVGLLPSIDDEVDTGWLDRQDLSAELPGLEHVAAAGLAVAAARRAPSPFPIAWRNNPSQPQTVQVGEHVISYSHDRSDQLVSLAVDGDAVHLDAHRCDAIARIDTYVTADRVWTGGGCFAFTVPPQFAAPDDAQHRGSTLAPMPGVVRQLLVAAGDHVVAGQPLAVMEAMKMEHHVTAPSDGEVAAVFVTEGQQVAANEPLLQLSSPDHDQSDNPNDAAPAEKPA